MKKATVRQKLKSEAFAKAFLENDGNGTQAMLSVNPDLTPHSASTLASRMLDSVDTQAALASYTGTLREQYSSLLSQAIESVRKDINHDNILQRNFALRWIGDLAKALSPSAPREGAKHVHLSLPKR